MPFHLLLLLLVASVKKMLSQGEITGIRELLARLEGDVVYSLADTATKRALAFTSVNGDFVMNNL